MFVFTATVRAQSFNADGYTCGDLLASNPKNKPGFVKMIAASNAMNWAVGYLQGATETETKSTVSGKEFLAALNKTVGKICKTEPDLTIHQAVIKIQSGN